MAGRPVSARGGGLSGMTYGFIAMTIVSVVLLVLYIIQLTSNQSLVEQAKTDREKALRYGSPHAYYEEEARNRHSNAFSVMDEDRKRVATLVGAQQDAVAVTLVTQAKELLASVVAENPGVAALEDSLMTTIKKLSGATKASREEKNAEHSKLLESQDKENSLTKQLETVRKDFDAQITEMANRLHAAEDEKVKSIGAKDEQVTNIQNELNTVQQQLQTLIRDGNKDKQLLEIEIARREREIGDLREKLRAINPETFDPNAILTKADGKILRAIPGSDVVYVNLGDADKIKVGMGFEVYSQTREVPKGLRGKASIEVVTIMQDTAECRVMRNDATSPIIEGDIIVNIAFERGRVPKFFIVGDFDLNYDNIAEIDGPDKIAGMVRAWGGQVVNQLDESVDYVVVGTGPLVPQLPANASDIVRDEVQHAQLESSRFKRDIETARSRFIPVITQQQFLFLTGYSGESAFTRR